MNLFKLSVIFLFAFVLTLIACKQDGYYLDGGLSGQSDYEKNLSTYDLLKQHSEHKFDSLIKVIDLTNTKDLINQNGITFYALSNRSIIRFQSRYFAADRLGARRLDKISKDTLTLLLKRFIVPNQQITLENVIQNQTVYTKDYHTDSIKLKRDGGGMDPNTNSPATAYMMIYTHIKIPKVDSLEMESGIQTHNLRSKNAVIHVLMDFADFGCGLRIPKYRYEEK